MFSCCSLSYVLDKWEVDVEEATDELLGEGYPLFDVKDLQLPIPGISEEVYKFDNGEGLKTSVTYSSKLVLDLCFVTILFRAENLSS